jgi:hypothetical protein
MSTPTNTDDDEFQFPLQGGDQEKLTEFLKAHENCTEYAVCKEHMLDLITGKQVKLYVDDRGEVSERHVMFLCCSCYHGTKSGYSCRACGSW